MNQLHPGTLVIAAVSSMAVAYLMPHIWTPGTLPAAAMAPVLMAVFSEALRAPPKLMRKVTTHTERSIEVKDPVTDETAVMQVVRGHKRIDQRLLVGAIGLGLIGFIVAALVVTGADFASGSDVKLWGGAKARATATATPAQDTSEQAPEPTQSATATPTPSPSETPEKATPEPTKTATATPSPTLTPAPPQPTTTPAPKTVPKTTPVAPEGVNANGTP